MRALDRSVRWWHRGTGERESWVVFPISTEARLHYVLESAFSCWLVLRGGDLLPFERRSLLLMSLGASPQWQREARPSRGS